MKKFIAILLVFIFLFSLCACKKEEPLPSEEIKEETFVKEFSDGRLYTQGDIYSFCETENYYFTLDKDKDGTYLSVFSKDGDLLKRVKPSIYNANREVILFPKTDIYPLGNDRIVFGSAFGLYSQYIYADAKLKCNIITNEDFPDLTISNAAFLRNTRGNYDILTLGGTNKLHKYDYNTMTPITSYDFLDYSDLSEYECSYPQTAFTDTKGNIYSYGYIEIPLDEHYIIGNAPTIVKYSKTARRIDYKTYHFQYDSVMEARMTGDCIAFAHAVNKNLFEYTNRLIVLDSELQELFTKDYEGECPVEIQALGENLAVSLYKNGGDIFSYVQIVDKKGNLKEEINHGLRYARIYSDNNGGFYITGKQGKDFHEPANTVIRHYDSNLNLLSDEVFITENDYDKGFGLYFETNKKGQLIAIQGNIENFPLCLEDKSNADGEYYNYENKFTLDEPTSTTPTEELPTTGRKNQLVFIGSFLSRITANNMHFILSEDEMHNNFLSCFNEDNVRIWQSPADPGSQKLHYFNNTLIIECGDAVQAFEPETGRCLWTMSLQWEPDTIGSTVINDKLNIIRVHKNKYSICRIDSNGDWEHQAMPKHGFGKLQERTFQVDPITGEFYCSAIKNKQTNIIKFDEQFRAVGHYTVDSYYNIEYIVNNGRVFIMHNHTENDNDYTIIYVLDSNFNIINTLEFIDSPCFAKCPVGRIGVAITNEGTKILDNDGNILKDLSGSNISDNFFKTHKGYAASSYVNVGKFKIYEYDNDFNVTNVTFYETKDYCRLAFYYKGQIITD